MYVLENSTIFHFFICLLPLTKIRYWIIIRDVKNTDLIASGWGNRPDDARQPGLSKVLNPTG